MSELVPPEIKVQNIVAAFSFEPPLDLDAIKEAFQKECFFETLKDRRYTFRVVALRTKKPRFTFLIYRTGKIVCTGSKNVDDAKRSDKYLLNRLRKAQINARIKTNAKIQNIVATSLLKNPVDLEKFVTLLQKDRQFHALYEPEQFPGAIIKFSVNEDNEATILLFSSGKLVCVGLTNLEKICKAIHTLKRKFIP